MIWQAQQIQDALDRIRLHVATDFVALAAPESDGQMRWQYASGNRNDRYKRIVLRSGKCLASRVLLHGRPIAVEGIFPQAGDDPREYPILLAEGLCSALAVPVLCQERVRGVLMMASRTLRTYGQDDMSAALHLAQRLGTVYREV